MNAPHEPTYARAVLARLVDAGAGVSLAARLFPSQPERAALSFLAVNGWARRGRSGVRGQIDYRATALGREQHGKWLKEARAEGAQVARDLLAPMAPLERLSARADAVADLERDFASRVDAGTCPRCGAKVFDGLRLTACSACGWKREASPPAAPRPLALVPSPIGTYARLLQRFAVGQSVRAVVGIFDATTGRDIDEGALGTVRAVNVGGCTPLVAVAWEGYGEDESLTTSAENLEPVLGGPAAECRHPAHELVNVRVPGRETTLAACRCGQVQGSPASPWREPTAEEFQSILAHVGHPGPKARVSAAQAPAVVRLVGAPPSAEAERDGWRWSFACLASIALELTGAAVSPGRDVDGKPFAVVPLGLVNRLRGACDELPASMLEQRDARRELLANLEQLERDFAELEAGLGENAASGRTDDAEAFAGNAGNFLGAIRQYLRAEEGGS